MEKIQNKFFDLILFGVSFVVSFFRSIFALFGLTGTPKKGVFFKALDFVFRLWPSVFWKKPSLFKIGAFFSSFIQYVFYNKK